jgi:hypothetical protein
MKAPDGTIDLLGSGFMLANNILGLVTEFAPDKDTRKANRKQRMIRVAIRRLTHKYKGADVSLYVKANFSEFTEEEQKETTDYITQIINLDK